MNKEHVYKSLGVIEAAIMCAKDTIGFVNSDYVIEHLTAVQEWVDKSEVVERILVKTEKYENVNFSDEMICKVIKTSHQWYDGVCDYCGKVKDEA